MGKSMENFNQGKESMRKIQTEISKLMNSGSTKNLRGNSTEEDKDQISELQDKVEKPIKKVQKIIRKNEENIRRMGKH